MSLPRPASYLDVASCYSWFVAQMSERGYDAYGLERDPLARPLGRAAFGVDPSQVMIGDAVELLSRSDRQWDVVSCLSLLHHFALGRGSVGAEEFARLLDKVTAHVLILDTGETSRGVAAQPAAGLGHRRRAGVPAARDELRRGHRSRAGRGRRAAVRGELRAAPVRVRPSLTRRPTVTRW